MTGKVPAVVPAPRTRSAPVRPAGPPTPDLRAALEKVLSAQGRRTRVRQIERRPAAYRTSSAMEELTVTRDDGTTLPLLFKNLDRRALEGDARWVKPGFVRAPVREIATYRSVLAPYGVSAPTFHGAVVDERRDRYWLFLELVPAWRLFSYEEPVWRRAARWLAGMHDRFQDGPDLDDLASRAHLLRCDGDFFRVWARRALAFAPWDTPDAPPGRIQAFRELIRRYDTVIDRLVALPRTFLHGEFFASNVLVRDRGEGAICPVDWEMAAIGPGLLDLAALTAGSWTAQERARLALAYLAERARPVADGDVLAALDLCQLHLAVQWLGWSRRWTPPGDESSDWQETALRIATARGLL